MEHPQTLKPKNIQSVAMATVVARYPQKLIRSGSSWGKHILKIWSKSMHGFRLWNTHKLYDPKILKVLLWQQLLPDTPQKLISY